MWPACSICMYMMSWNEDEARIEASLGGRITAAEISVLGEELRDVVEAMNSQPYLLLLDYSRAHTLDGEAATELNILKDYCLAHGADKIVSIVYDDDAVSNHTQQRLQLVLEGREAIVAQGDEARYLEPAAAIIDIEEYRKAA